jgi:hypothetical protein
MSQWVVHLDGFKAACSSTESEVFFFVIMVYLVGSSK